MWGHCGMKRSNYAIVSSSVLGAVLFSVSGNNSLAEGVGFAEDFKDKLGFACAIAVAMLPLLELSGQTHFTSGIIERFSSLKEYLKDWYSGKPRLNTENFRKFFDELELKLKSKIVGQDKAIAKVISLLKSHYANVFFAEKTGKEYSRGLVLYLPGPPGVGKTYLLDEISKAIRLPVVGMSYDAIVKHGILLSNKQAGIAASLLAPGIDFETNKYVYTDFCKSLKKGGNYVYNINEIEKLRFLDYRMRDMSEKDILNSNGKQIPSTLDEMFRDFMDSGKILGYDAKGSILVLTSNETIDDINKLEDSLVSRLSNFIVPFEYLKEDADCEKCMKLHLSESCGDFFKKQEISVAFDDGALKNFVATVPVEQRTGRYFKDTVQNLADKIYAHHSDHIGQKNIIISWSKEKGFYIGN